MGVDVAERPIEVAEREPACSFYPSESPSRLYEIGDKDDFLEHAHGTPARGVELNASENFLVMDSKVPLRYGPPCSGVKEERITENLEGNCNLRTGLLYQVLHVLEGEVPGDIVEERRDLRLFNAAPIARCKQRCGLLHPERVPVPFFRNIAFNAFLDRADIKRAVHALRELPCYVPSFRHRMRTRSGYSHLTNPGRAGFS